jgi:Cu(I)/Ag(I) efflux system membrane protein CusA/SilA
MFLVLYWHFHSTQMVLQIMVNIPFAFIGSVAALWLANETFSVASLVGFISLCGISSRNGVLMISHYIHLMTEEKMPFGKDMVIRGSQERVAPVLMTALTAGLGLIPLVLASGQPGKEILYPVALVVLGGLFTCTILDFFVTPTVFLKFGRRSALRLVERYNRRMETSSESVTDSHPSDKALNVAGPQDKTRAGAVVVSGNGITL